MSGKDHHSILMSLSSGRMRSFDAATTITTTTP